MTDMKMAYIKAVEMAVIAHKDARRKYRDEPYVVHPIRVSKIILEYTGDWELAAAAVLHDTLEDTTLNPMAISDAFSDYMLMLVESVTKIKTLEKAPREEEYLKRFKVADDNTVILKLADRLDNVRDTQRPGTPPKFKESYTKNTVGLLQAIPDSARDNPTVVALTAEIIKAISDAP